MVIAAVAAGILLAIWLGFKVTENGVFTVIDYSAPEIRVPVLYNEGMSRKIQRRRKPRRSVVIAAVAAGILLAVWLGFKVTENGVFTVIDYSADPKEIGTWKHYGFAAAKLNALDPDTPACIENESGKVVAIRSGHRRVSRMNPGRWWRSAAAWWIFRGSR